MATPITGMTLDCGSGHTSILWYELPSPRQRIRQLRRSKLKIAGGGSFKITDVFSAPVRVDLCELGPEFARQAAMAAMADSFAAALHAEIADAAAAGIRAPALVIVGATGGLRNMLSDGHISMASVAEFERALLVGMQGVHVKFEVVSGEQEADWELAAALLIYGPRQPIMFPEGAAGFGLFSGGGSSVQVQASAGPPLSFAFSTWCEEVDGVRRSLEPRAAGF